METIGFDLYMEDLLQESLGRNSRPGHPGPWKTPRSSLPITRFIPPRWITEGRREDAAYRAAAACGGKGETAGARADWIDRVRRPAGRRCETACCQLMELKTDRQARRLFRASTREKPQSGARKPRWKKPAFRLLRQGFDLKHRDGRLVYQARRGRPNRGPPKKKKFWGFFGGGPGRPVCCPPTQGSSKP